MKELTLKGYIVIGVGCYGHIDNDIRIQIEKENGNLEKLHLVKILLADSIFVIDKSGHIGDSTKKEIEFSKSHNKWIYYFSRNDLLKIPYCENLEI